jgi:hypothetical protein
MTWEEIMRRVLPPVGGLSPQITRPGGFGAGIEQGRRPPSTIPHKGVDFNFPVGQTGINLTNPVLHSPVAGVVLNAGEGNVGRIAIRDTNGFVHEILHTQTQNVKKGDLVGVGTAIGTMGNTGVNHDHPKDGQYRVHYQLKDRVGNVINPTEFWNNLEPGKGDPGQPAFLDQSKRGAEILSGLNETSAYNRGFPPDRPGNRFFNPFNQAPVAGFVPLPDAPAASDAPANFADRYGNWAAKSGLDNISAPAPQPAPNQGKRSEQDDTPVRILSRVNLSPASASASGDAPPLTPPASPPLLGIFSGKPMPDYPAWHSIFATDNRPSPDNNELYQRWRQWLAA